MEAIISPSNRVVDRGPSKHVDRLGFDIWHRVFLARFGGIRSDAAAAAAAAMFWRAWMRAAVRQKVILAAVNYMLNQTWCSTILFLIVPRWQQKSISPLVGDAMMLTGSVPVIFFVRSSFRFLLQRHGLFLRPGGGVYRRHVVCHIRRKVARNHVIRDLLS